MASLLLSTGKYLHTAYAVSNIAEEFTNDDWSLSSQEGFGYIGQYIDDSAVDSSDPTDYVWTEFLDEDVDDLDDEGDMPMADFQSQIDALQDQIEVLQGDTENLQSNIEVNASNVADSAQLASEAADIANATGQYFWHDANGAHVSTEENNPEGERNSIWNSLGMLFRKGATNLLAVLAGGASGTDPKGIAVYDGEGNNAENVVASFTDSGSVIGKQDSARTVIQKDNISMIDENGSTNLVIESSGIEGNVPYRKGLGSEFPLGINAEKSVNIFNEFPKPPNGTVIDLEIEKSSSNPIILSFAVGTSSTETASDDGSTCSVSFDGDKILTFIPSSGSVWYPHWVAWTAHEIAPCYTFGSRAITDDNDNPITTRGEFSMTVGTGLTSTAPGGGGLAIGRHNTIEHASDLFIIGNGSGKAARNDAFRVGAYGSVYASGSLTASDITASGNLTAANLTGSQTADYTGSYTMGNCTILTGSVTINVTTANTNTDKTVTFGPTFKHTPCIQCTMLNIGGSYYQRVTAAGPSTTGFTARIRAGGAPGNVVVNWVAIGELA